MFYPVSIIRGSVLCHHCGRKFKPSGRTMDHIVPIGRGGKSTKGNVVSARKECNTRKKYLPPIEWEAYLKSVREEGAGEGNNLSS